MKSMLDRAMDADFTEQQGEVLKSEYRARFSFLCELFQGHPFELPPDDKGRIRVSAAVYDASMVALNELWGQRDAIAADAEGVRVRMTAALSDEGQLTVLTGAGNTANAVRDRIVLMRQILCPE